MQMTTGVLREDLQIIEPGEHGPDFLLFDAVSEQYFKIDPYAINIIRLFNYPQSFADFLAKAANNGTPISEARLSELIIFMRTNHLFVPEYGQVEHEMAQNKIAKDKTFFDRMAGMYLFFRLPPLHPDWLFALFTPIVTLLFNRLIRWLLIIIAIVGYVNLLRHANEVLATFVDSLSWAGLVRYFWALMIVKIVHELAHGFTAKAFNCRVRSVGVAFIVFYPRMFTDVTDSWRLSPRKRLMIDGAGIFAELLLGGLAALLWSYSTPGGFKSTMFYLFAVSTLGTIFVNGNPFIRYDGYYLLSDILRADNLMQRAGAYASAVNRWLLFGGGAVPDHGDTSRIFLYFFGVGAFLYRIFLATSIILIIYYQFAKPIAMVLVLVELYVFIWLPLYRELQIVWRVGKRYYMRMFLAMLLLCAAFYYVVTLPIPWGIELSGEIKPVKTTPVYVGESGYTAEKLPEEIRPVKEGELLLPLSNILLLNNIKRYELLTAQDKVQVEILRSTPATINSAKTAYEKLQTDIVTLNEMRRRADGLPIIAPMAGIFIPKINDLHRDKWVEKGMLIGEIVSPEKIVTAYVLEQDVNRLALLDNVKIVLENEMDFGVGVVTAIIPLAARLKDTALVQNFGGPIPCYYDQFTGEFIPTNTYYAVKIVLSNVPESYLSGRTGKIKIVKSYSLIESAYRWVIHAVLREFSF